MKRKRAAKGISIEVDKLTNSIESRFSGDIFDTEFYRLWKSNKKEIKSKDWLFDWHKEIDYTNREIYKLIIKDNINVIQGLMSLSIEPDHVLIHLIESAKFNSGKNKAFIGIAGNMFAFACKKSKELGYKGYVGFVAKTNLVEHYKKTLGAQLLGMQRMAIDETAANKLINQYFKS